MNGVRPLALIMAVVTACVALASLWPHFAGGPASRPAETVEGAVLHQDCVDDVSITAPWVAEALTFTLKDPPDYADGDDVQIYYDVTNSSCREVTVTVALTGSVSNATIHDADGSSAPCTKGCTIAAGETKNENVQWDLGKHPNATGEKVVATVTITAPDDFVDADTSNNTATSAQSINIVNEEPAPDIAVKSVTASKTTAVIGETVDFTVRVQNEGDADAGADTTVTLDQGADTTALDSDMVSALAVNAEGTVTLTWDTDGAAAGKHSLRALAQTEGDDNADNDSKTETVTLVERSVDVAVKSVTASATEAVVGDTVDFTVVLENDGNVAAVKPDVSLFDANGAEDAGPLASETANTIAVGEETTVTISWDTDAAAGVYSLRLVVTVADDDDVSNDSATASLTLHDPADVELSFTNLVADTAVAGNSVSVPFTVTNAGEKDAGEISISLYVTKDGEDQDDTPTDTATVTALAVGASASGALTWDTSMAAVDDYKLDVVAETAGDIDESNNSITSDIEIRNWLLLKNVSPTSAAAVTGDTVKFTAQVENVGTGEMTAVSVGLYESDADVALADVDFASIAAGGTADAAFQWDTAGRDAGQVELIVAAGGNGQVADGDDHQSVNVTIRNPIALSSAVLASTDHIAGIPVSINVEVLNESIAEVTGVEVKLDDVVSCDDENRNKEKDCATPAAIAAIPAGKTATASLTWDTAGVASGDHELKIVASVTGYGGDENDELSLTVALRDPVVNVALTAATINRNVAAIGQTVEVVATVANHGEVPVAAPVMLYRVQDLDDTTAVAKEISPLIEPGSNENVKLQWDTTGNPSGKYDLQVSVDLPDDTTVDDNEELLEVELFRSAYDGSDDPDSCVEDVRVGIAGIRDIAGELQSPPDYQVGEDLRIVYQIYNFSCQTDVTLRLEMTGPNDRAIDEVAAICFSDCVVPYGGKAEGEIAWTIPTLPALSDQSVSAAATVVSPTDFVDVDESNNSNPSTDRINIVHPDDLVLDLVEETGHNVSTRQQLTGPSFGMVDVRLVSADPLKTTLPFAADAVEVVATVANDGTTPEPAAIQFLWHPQGETEAMELSRHVVMVPAGKTKAASLQVPIRDLPPGKHSIDVLLSAAVDLSPDNNATAIEITRMEPLVDVAVTVVSVSPEVLFLGAAATLSLTVQNNSEVPLPLTASLYLDDAEKPVKTKGINELEPGEQIEESITWKLPASAKYLGQRALKLALESIEYGRVAEVSRDATLHIDAEIIGISASPPDTVMPGEEVEIAVEVRNNGPTAANVPVTLKFPSDAKLPETRHPPVNAGATETARFTWKTGSYDPGQYMLMADIPAEHNITTGQTLAELPFLITPLVITASIVDVAVSPEDPMVGEPVSIMVTVRNDGPLAANVPVTLHFPAGGKQPQTRKPRLDPGETGTATFEWLTSNYRPGTHRLRVELAAVGNPTEYQDMKLLPTVVNAAIVGMSTYPAETAMVGEAVEVWVQVRNDGPLAIRIPVQLTFPSASKRPERSSPRVEPGDTATVKFTWKTSNYEAGEHSLRADILADGNITSGQKSAEIPFRLTPLIITASIVDVAVSPETPTVGEVVTIAVTVRNDGPLAANIPVTLYFPAGGKQPQTRKPRLDPGETGTAVFEWLTSNYRPGTHRLRVELAAVSNPTEYRYVQLLPTVVNAAIVGMGTYPAETAMVGEAVEVWVQVRNDGPLAVRIPVQLTLPSADKQPERKSPRVEPGDTATVTFEWKTSNYEADEHLLRADILVDGNITSGQKSAEIPFRLTPLIITASIVDVAVSPETPTVGEAVTIAVTVRNDGLVAARIPVTLHFPSSDKQPETRRPRVEPGAVGSVSFTWLTSRHKPGIHDFRAEVPNDPPASQRFEIELLPLLVDVAIVRMGSDPTETAMKGQAVEIWVDVINHGPSALNVPLELAFPTDEKEPERKSAKIEPGQTARVEFTWKTSNYDVGVHTLTVTLLTEYNITTGQTLAELPFLITPLVITASIVDVAVSPEYPMVGEPVSIMVTVRNDGPLAANVPVTLHFPAGGKQPQTRKPRLDPGETWTVVFEWLTGNYRPGTQHFFVEVAAVDAPQQRFTIELLPIVENVALVSMGTYPVETAMAGEPVEVWIDVRNDGPVALNVPVRLTFPSASKRPEVRSPRVAPGETVKVYFEWKTSNYEPGIHTLRAAILLAGNLTRGRATGEIRFTLTPLVINATILSVAANPEEPRVGEPVTITVTVRNDGIVAANVPVTLLFPSSDKQPETRRLRVEPGAVGSVSFTWRTSRYEPGIHSFLVEASGDPPSSQRFEIELLPPLVDVAIVGMGSDPSETAVQGQEVKIWVDVINNGRSALNVPVRLSFPSGDKQPERASSRIEPGEIARIEFTWKTSNYDVGVHTLTATLLAEYNITELDTSAAIQIRLVSARLIASIVNISWNPDSPVVGEPARITVTVRNDGPLAANIPVTLYFPSGDKQPETRRPRVASGAVGTASFTWRTSRYEPGDHVFRVQIPGMAGAVRTFEIGLRPPEVDFAIAGLEAPDPLHPIVKGDWVEMTVVVQNQGPYAGRGTVYLLNGANLDTMYEQGASLEPGETREVEFTWKTLRYPAGGYELLARVDAEYDTAPDNDESDRVHVHLLTDRDITVGFGNNLRPAVFTEPTSGADLSSVPRYRNDISVVVGQIPIDLPGSPAFGPPMGASPKPTGGNYDPARMYWQWRSAQLSSWECARYQGAIGESLPRAVLCPRAPSVVR